MVIMTNPFANASLKGLLSAPVPFGRNQRNIDMVW